MRRNLMAGAHLKVEGSVSVQAQKVCHATCCIRFYAFVAVKKYRLVDQILTNSGKRACRVNSFLIHHGKFGMQGLVDKQLTLNMKKRRV